MRTSYRRETSRRKSLRKSTWNWCFALYSFSEYVESTLIGTTVTPRATNWSWSSRISHNSAVQVLENASGKNARSTGLPRSDESVSFSPAVEARVKSGARSPTDGVGGELGAALTTVMSCNVQAGMTHGI